MSIEKSHKDCAYIVPLGALVYMHMHMHMHMHIRMYVVVKKKTTCMKCTLSLLVESELASCNSALK